MMRLLCILPSFLVVAASLASPIASPTANASEDAEGIAYFEKHIRPLFAQQCISCHGSQKQKGGLRLDQPELIARGGDTGKIFVAGKPENSLLYQAVCYQDDALKMPPRGKLSAEQVEHIKQWIAKGASLPKGQETALSEKTFDLKERSKHWCYQPIKSLPAGVNVPQLMQKLVQEKWDKLGLQPTPITDSSMLLRRVYFDLLGLPPTVEQLDALNSKGQAASWSSVVDELLNRPEYGERMARHWLDLMRYADTMGHEFDFDISNAWRYRNYVIRAFNDDVPYNQFVLEHLAGDLLPKPRLSEKEQWNESIQATGFLWLGEAKQAPVDVKQEQADRIDNQIDVIGKAFLGQTIACARCHDHKFDAIASRDYYALYGVLKSSRYQQVSIDTPDRFAAAIELYEQLNSRIQQLATQKPANPIPVSKGKPLEWKVAQGNAWRQNDKQQAVLYQAARTTQWKLRYIPEKAWDSGVLSTALEGSLQSETVAVDQDYLHIAAAGSGCRLRVVVDGFNVIRDPIYGSLRKIVNDVQPRWYTFDMKMWKGRQVYVECLDGGPEDPGVALDFPKGRESWMQVLYGSLSNDRKPPVELSNNHESVMPLEEQWLTLAKQREMLDKLCPTPRYAIATLDGTGEDERIFVRGNHRLPGDRASRGLLPIFCGSEPLAVNTGSGRLELAQRLIDPKRNPLLVRVIVNRIWKQHFGEGLVRSVDDFGKMGEAPSHPELLDALCQWFVTEGGWSVKKLHRLLITSSVYTLPSHADGETVKKDPDGRCLSRLPMRRLEAEAIRDAMLQLAGLRKSGMTDSGVMPYLSPLAQGRGRPSIPGPLTGDGVRSIYLNVRRNFLPSFMTAFDYPTPFTAIGKRSVSNTPTQSLAMMNDPMVIELAKRWAGRIVQENKSPEARIDQMYREAFARMPTTEEKQQLLEYQQKSNGHEAWTEIAHALFCSKEFRYIP